MVKCLSWLLIQLQAGVSRHQGPENWAEAEQTRKIYGRQLFSSTMLTIKYADHALVMRNYQDTLIVLRTREGPTLWPGNYDDSGDNNDDGVETEVTNNALPNPELVCHQLK